MSEHPPFNGLRLWDLGSAVVRGWQGLGNWKVLAETDAMNLVLSRKHVGHSAWNLEASVHA
jgi:hypothetical protein